MRTMDQLPVELVVEIGRLIGRKGSFRLRRVNRYLCDVFTPLLFETIYIGWMPQHLEHLERLAKSPTVKHIRCLCINIEVLPQLHWRDWLWALRDTIEESSRSDPDERFYMFELIQEIVYRKYTKSEVAVAYKAFKTLSVIQHDQSSRMGEILGSAFESLANLKRLELHDRRGVFCARKGENQEDTLATCSPWKDSLVKPEHYYGRLLHRWLSESYPPGNGNLSSTQALRFTMPLMASATDCTDFTPLVSVEALTFDVGHHIPVSGWSFHKDPELNGIEVRCAPAQFTRKIRGLCNMFKSLTRVQLHMRSEQFHKSKEVCREIAYGLSHATNLRRLELNNSGSYCQRFFDELAALDVHRPWPVLDHLQITGHTCAKSLKKIVCMNADSLRVLVLIDVALCSAARWDDFFESIQPVLQLRKANVRQLQDDTRRWPLRDLRWRCTFFAGSKKSKSVMHLAVEDFLSKQRNELPRQDHWEATGPRIAGFDTLMALALADDSWKDVSKLPLWTDSLDMSTPT